MLDFLYTIVVYPLVLILETVYMFFFKVLDNYGIALIVISLAVNFLTLPLYAIAERWQQVERDIQKKLKPKTDKIKAVFKGDEQYMILSAWYRQNHYHPIYALRSSISLLIQIPFFIAAYSFIANLRILDGQSFWFITDLSRPDGLLRIGNIRINILPLIMTAVNIVAGIIYTKGFPLKEKVQLYAMAGLFLVLLYNSPAALAFYWTLNNVFSLIKNIVYKMKQPLRFAYCSVSAVILFAMVYISFFAPGRTFQRKIIFDGIGALVLLSPLLVKFVKYLIRKPLSALASSDKKRFGLCLGSCILLCLLAGFVIPSSLIASSPQEFAFIGSFTNPLQLLVQPFIQSIGFFIFWPLCIYFLFSKKVQTILTWALFCSGIISLLNIYIFPGDYGNISPYLLLEKADLLHLSYSMFIDIAAAAVFVFIITLLCKFKKINLLAGFSGIALCSCILFVVLNIITIQETYSALAAIRPEERNYAGSSSENIRPVFHLTKTGKNIFIIMLDRAISSFIPYIFAESPDLYDQYDGFVYYPNTVSFSHTTATAAPALYGGYEYTPENINARNNESLVSKHNEALSVMPKLFLSAGFSATTVQAPWANYSWIPDNTIFSAYPGVRAFNLNQNFYTQIWKSEHNFPEQPLDTTLRRNLLGFSFFRMAPRLLRGQIYDEGVYWSSLLMTQNIPGLDSYVVLDYLSRFTDGTAESDTFTMMCNDTTHDPARMQPPDYTPSRYPVHIDSVWQDEEFSLIHYHANTAAVKRLGTWLTYLKEEGLYDNTRIIIVSDHGIELRSPVLNNGGWDIVDYVTYNPLLLVKDFGALGSLRTDNSFMTNADVPYLAVRDVIKNPVNPFTGKAIAPYDKKNGIILTTSTVWKLRKPNLTQFEIKNKEWLRVKDSIFNIENWSSVK